MFSTFPILRCHILALRCRPGRLGRGHELCCFNLSRWESQSPSAAPALPIPAYPLGERLRMSHLRSQPPHFPLILIKGRGRDPQRSDKPEVTQQVGQCQLGPALSPVLPTQGFCCLAGVPPAGPAAPTPSVTPASAFTGSGNPHHQQLPALRVPSGHPGENPTAFSAACPLRPFYQPATPASGPGRVHPLSLTSHTRSLPTCGCRSCLEMRLSRSTSRWW